MQADDKDWTKERLMGGASEETAKKGAKGRGVEEDPMLWGLPGHLTSEEADIFFQFQQEIQKRGQDFRDTIFSFGEEEGEVWALCRWLRARKFVLSDVLAMVEEATEARNEAKKNDFYPDPVHSLGVEQNLYFAQYPQLYYGMSKSGSPIFISKPGILNVDGVECITTLEGILKFHWYVMMHDYKSRLQRVKNENPETFKKFDCFCILDLNKLTMSQLSKRALAIVKEQSAIDSLCFPETMAKMIIVNAPTFFAATWRIIKGWLDPRTASKIEVISSAAKVEKRLLELVDADQLVADYGGSAPHTEALLHQEYDTGDSRIETKVMYVRGHGSETVEVLSGERCRVTVFTRSTAGANFTLTDAKTKTHFVENVLAKHHGSDDENERPTATPINESAPVVGPCTLKIKADSHASRFSTQHFLVAFNFEK